MVGSIGPMDAWLVLADGAGVLAVFAAWLLLSGAGDRVRAYGAAAGAALVALGLGSAFLRVTTNVSNLTLDVSLSGGRIATYAFLLAGGVAAGVAGVAAARQRAPGTRRLPVELGAVAVAVALPSLVHPAAGERVPDTWEVTAAVVAVHLLSGVAAAGALLVVLGYADDPPVGLVAGAFALVGVVTVIGWVWHGQVANEYWAMFATGLAAGLLAAVALPVVRTVVPDASAVVPGALAVLVVLALTGLAYGQAFREYGKMQGDLILDTTEEGPP